MTIYLYKNPFIFWASFWNGKCEGKKKGKFMNDMFLLRNKIKDEGTKLP